MYHGNLSLSDNYNLIIQLLSNDLKNCTYKIILAGKNPHTTLQKFVKGKNNIELIANPTDEILNGLMKEAHICLAMAANPSGVKLKLINSLFNARFVISNEAALTGSGLDSLVYITEENDLPDLIDKLMLKEFKQEEIDERNSLLSEKYNNLNNARQIIAQL